MPSVALGTLLTRNWGVVLIEGGSSGIGKMGKIGRIGINRKCPSSAALPIKL